MPASSVLLDTQPPLQWLAGQQRRILGIVDGLDDDAMREPVLPSGWSCAGMIQHLTATTRFWLVEVMAGKRDEAAVQQSELDTDDLDEDDFRVDSTRPTSALVAAYGDTSREAIELVRGLGLDAAPAWWPEGRWGGWRLHTFHDVLLHLLVETTCHAGHLDAARELIDGRTWDYAQGRLGAADVRGD